MKLNLKQDKMSTTTRVVTGKVRMSYANVFEARAVQEGQDPKFSVSIIISKKDADTLKRIRAAIEVVKKSPEALAKWGGKAPANLKLPLRDGDEDREDDEAYQNSFFVNCNSKNRPQVVDRDRNPILDSEEFYSGCYGRVSINFYAYNFNGTKGIAAGLGNCQFLEDGDRLSGGSTAEEDFGDEDNSLL